jgi:hypothetical protein
MATRMTTRRFQALICALWLPVVWAQSKPVPQRPLAAKEEQVSAELIEIAQRVHEGKLPCELGASVLVARDAAAPGYFLIHGKGFRYRMKMMSTTTGAIRLEDAKAGAVWLQLANKSMLMDQKKGRRLADECAHPDQLAFAQDKIKNPPPSLIDTTGMGR